MSVSVQEADFDVGAETAALSAGRLDVGAVATFVGLVRADKLIGAGSEVSAMTLEHYPGMTEKSLEAILAEAGGRWQLQGVRVIHRFGRLLPGDRIVFVGVASAHRAMLLPPASSSWITSRPARPSGRRKTPPTAGTGWMPARPTTRRLRAGRTSVQGFIVGP